MSHEPGVQGGGNSRGCVTQPCHRTEVEKDELWAPKFPLPWGRLGAWGLLRAGPSSVLQVCSFSYKMGLRMSPPTRGWGEAGKAPSPGPALWVVSISFFFLVGS